MAVAVLAPSHATYGQRIKGGLQYCGQRSPVITNVPWNYGVVGQRSRANSDSSSPSESPNQTPRYVHQQQVLCSSSSSVSLGKDARFEAVLRSAKAQGKTTVCIWFHFLAGKGADWEQCLKAKIANQLPWVEWYFPDAPKKPVTNYNGSVERCWFDQLEGQVTESMATPGLETSVSRVHALLRQAEAHGFPSSRILLGGMSQGGVLAMTAGLSYDKPLAGIMATSAWVPPGLPAFIRQPSTPLMIGNGDRDGVVPVSMFQNSVRKLKKAGCSRISTKIYPGLDHTWKDHECQDVKQFIQVVAPDTQANIERPNVAAPMWGFPVEHHAKHCL
eukprot:CAMPEP_0169135828 /NCGR_PEP_ID=MMETSP1015-20121227/40650_1 /TAXON_ID=342587 /ORGANISM="Karlodinium micrum, Strain CCMP2283" /LENGTH=330 /DNA_ID=CAMNT_0009200505 /DNA_START=73 /DNA_END=1065 /DNA_ORIENTATION=-